MVSSFRLVSKSSGVALAAFSLLGIARNSNADWTVVNLHPPGATQSRCVGIDNGKQIGTAVIGGRNHAGLWSGSAGSFVDLHPLGWTSSVGLGVGGGQQGGLRNGGQFATIWAGTPESWTNLHPTGAVSSLVTGVDGSQQVGYVAFGPDHAFVWNGTAESGVDLHPVGMSNSLAWGVHNGQQVGRVQVAPLTYHATLWTGSVASRIDLHPVGMPGASEALGVHNGVQVGFTANPNPSLRACLWRGTSASFVELHPLGSGGSAAYAASGDYQVGSARIGSPFHAVIWNGSASSMVDLHLMLPPTFTSSEARGIWQDGSTIYVVGFGSNSATGRIEALQWISGPVDSDGDGLYDGDEVNLHFTNPNDPDTDDDGLLDGTEVDMAAGGGCPNPLDPDSDDDGLNDGQEVAIGTSTCNPDTDGDGLNDRLDPTPLVPGATTSWIEAMVRQMAADTLSIQLSCFAAPNANAAKGRRNALSNKLTSAANLLADSDRLGAIDVLFDVLEKLDGEPNPPDWLHDCPLRDDMHLDVLLMIALLSIP